MARPVSLFAAPPAERQAQCLLRLTPFNASTASLLQAESFFFIIGQTGFHLNSNEWMSRMTAPECYPVTLSFKLFTTFSVCAFPMRTLSTKRLFITGIMHSVFAYAKREACRTGTAGSQRPSRNLHERTTKKGMNSQSPMKQNPEQTLFLLSSFHQLLSLRHSPC